MYCKNFRDTLEWNLVIFLHLLSDKTVVVHAQMTKKQPAVQGSKMVIKLLHKS